MRTEGTLRACACACVLQKGQKLNMRIERGRSVCVCVHAAPLRPGGPD